jgi:hypothetical protein
MGSKTQNQSAVLGAPTVALFGKQNFVDLRRFLFFHLTHA